MVRESVTSARAHVFYLFYILRTIVHTFIYIYIFCVSVTFEKGEKHSWKKKLSNVCRNESVQAPTTMSELILIEFNFLCEILNRCEILSLLPHDIEPCSLEKIVNVSRKRRGWKMAKTIVDEFAFRLQGYQLFATPCIGQLDTSRVQSRQQWCSEELGEGKRRIRIGNLT